MSITSKARNLLLHPLKSTRKVIDLIKYKRRFIEYHWSCRVSPSRQIRSDKPCLKLGKMCYIGPGARIQGVFRYNDKCFTPLITMEEGVSIQQNIHLTCASRVTIGANTAIGANVTITDINHPYEDVTLPIEAADITTADVMIGKDCKIYNNAVILPGVTIGRHCVVGANSVVNRSLPDYCVAVGAPARIVKRYDASLGKWLPTDENGAFITKK